MNTSPAQSIILGTMAVTVTDAIIGNIQATKATVPASRIIIGGYLVTMALLVGSEVNPKLAEGMSILIMLGSLFGPDGGALTKLVIRATDSAKPIHISQTKQPLRPIGVS